MSGAAFDAGANRLGALAMRITDRVKAAAATASGLSASAVAAMSVLDGFFAEPPSIDALRRLLDLTPSGGVRLVDVLESAGLVRRRPSHDGRVRVLAVTAKGRRAQLAIRAARAQVLVATLSVLSTSEREMLEPILDKLLIALVRGPHPGPAMCRLCATDVCGTEPGQPCPITRAALAEGGAAPPGPGRSSSTA